MAGGDAKGEAGALYALGRDTEESARVAPVQNKEGQDTSVSDLLNIGMIIICLPVGLVLFALHPVSLSLAGVAGVVAYFYADLPAGWEFILPCLLLLVLYGCAHLFFRPVGFGQQFAALSILAGMEGVVVHFYAGISVEKFVLPCSLILILHGGALWGYARWLDRTQIVAAAHRGKSQKEIAEAAQILRAEKRASQKSIAEIERKHKRELAAGEKIRADMQENMGKLQENMDKREGKARAEYDELEREKKGVELTLAGVRETLAYYSDEARVDVYEGADALYEDGVFDEDGETPRKRKCGGVYVIKNTGDGKVKIGETQNFAERFNQIRSHCASAGIKRDDILPVVLVPVDEGRYEVEQGIHEALSESRTAGEWFSVTPEEAVATVLAHVHGRRVRNYKARTKLPVGKGGGR